MLDTAAPAAPSKTANELAKAKDDKDSDISDNYDDDFGEDDESKKNTEAKKNEKKDSDDDDWGMDDDWGEDAADKINKGKKANAPDNAKTETDKTLRLFKAQS